MIKGARLELKVFIGEKHEFVTGLGVILIMKELTAKDWEPSFIFWLKLGFKVGQVELCTFQCFSEFKSSASSGCSGG